MGTFATAVLAGCGGGGGGGQATVAPQPMVSMVAYVINGGSNDVSAFAIDPATGMLTSVGPASSTGTGPIAIQAEPSGRFVYVANQGSNDVSSYAIDAATGRLTAVGSVASGTLAHSISLLAPGKFLFVTDIQGRNKGAYSISQTTGALSSLPTDAFAGRYVTLDPLGRFVFVVGDNGAVNTYSLNGTTGVPALVATATASSTAPVGIDPMGRFAYLPNSASNELSAYSINAETGKLTPVGVPVPGGYYSPEFEPKGRFLYAVSSLPSRPVYAINGVTGELTATGADASVSPTSALERTYVAGGKFVFDVTYSTTHAITQSLIETKAIDPATGALAAQSNIQLGGNVTLAVDPSGNFVYLANAAGLQSYAVNANTGALTAVGAAVAAGTSPGGITIAKLR